MENITCIICDSNNHNHYLNVIDRFDKKNIFNLVRCDCGFIFLNPRPRELDIHYFYPKNNYDPHNNNNSLFSKVYNIVKNNAFKRKIKLIQKYYTNCGKHLDIGGGTGDFCFFMKKNGWSSSNQDISKQALTISNKKGVDSLQRIDNNIESDSIDLVTAWHSIEHIHKIDDLFMQINRILKPNKYIFLCVPNFNAIEQSFFKEKWVAWDAPRHLYHFNPDLLKKYVEKNNFEVMYYETLFQDTAYNILLSMNKKNILDIFKSFFVLFLSYIMILLFGYKKSSSFIMICRKL